jgi:hypothetical protein
MCPTGPKKLNVKIPFDQGANYILQVDTVAESEQNPSFAHHEKPRDGTDKNQC